MELHRCRLRGMVQTGEIFSPIVHRNHLNIYSVQRESRFFSTSDRLECFLPLALRVRVRATRHIMRSHVNAHRAG